MRPGGHVFVGDVPNLTLCEAFHASVELTRATADTAAEVIRRRVARGMRHEQELMVAPEFFAALGARVAEIGAVEVQLRRGWEANELTRFRYDVTMAIGEPSQTEPPAEELAWEAVRSLEGLADFLRQQEPPALVVRGVPNGRVREAIDAVHWLSLEKRATAADWRGRTAADRGVEPEAVWALEETTGYEAHIGWSSEGAGDRFDALLRRRDAASIAVSASWQRWKMTVKPLSRCASDPRRFAAARQLPSILRSHLRQRLPDYMVPSTFVLLEALPVTPHGKVDRAKLPSPDEPRTVPDAACVAPRTYLEQQIAHVWHDVLGIKTVGINDNFFDLGGHSLLMVQGTPAVVRGAQTRPLDHSFLSYPSVSTLAAFFGDGADARAPVAVDDRAGKQRMVMNRRMPARYTIAPPVRSESLTVEGALDSVVMHSRLHPGQVSRMRRPGR